MAHAWLSPLADVERLTLTQAKTIVLYAINLDS